MKVHRDLRYSDGNARNLLDLYLPEGGPAPLVIYIHGGAFMMGDKANPDWGDLIAIQAVVDAGFAVASVNYRFVPEHIWPAQLEDLRAAVAFLRVVAGEYGFDGARIAAFGPSAGGHLTACLALDQGLRAAVPWFPPVDFRFMDADMAASGVERQAPPNAESGSPESKLIGGAVADHPDLAYRAGPLGVLDALPEGARIPPFFIQHGAVDPLIAARQSQRLAEALRARGGEVVLEILPGAGHGGPAFDRPETLARVTAFLTENLGV